MAQSRTLKGKPRKASKGSNTVKPRTTKAQRIASVNAQHGWLSAIAPLGILGLSVAGHLPWEMVKDAISLALIGNLIGYGFRRYNP